MSKVKVCQFYAELEDYSPKIWRRFQVAAKMPPSRFCYSVMGMYEMSASHLFSLTIPDSRSAAGEGDENIPTYEILAPEFEPEPDTLDATAYTLEKAMPLEPHPMAATLLYDFGDSWTVNLTLESVFTLDVEGLTAKDFPKILEGKGFGIIEDCGGTEGLKDIARAFKKGKGRAYKEYKAWLGVDSLDLDAFDVEDANLRVRRIPRLYADIYEHNKPLSKRSTDFLIRGYLRHWEWVRTTD